MRFSGFGQTLSFRPGEACRALSPTSMWATLRADVPSFNIAPGDVVDHSTSQWLVSAVLSPLRGILSHKWE